jgi:hypothetical protein
LAAEEAAAALEAAAAKKAAKEAKQAAAAGSRRQLGVGFPDAVSTLAATRHLATDKYTRANATNATTYDDDFGADIGDMVCSEGAFGPLCAACIEGYFLTDGLCQECNGASFVDSLQNIVVVCLAGLLIRAFIKNGGIPVPTALTSRYDWMPEKVQFPLINALTTIDGGAVKVIYSTIQIITSVSVNLDMTFPEPMSSMSGKVAFVQLDFLSISCMKGSSFHSNVYATSAFPLVLFAVVLASYVVSLQVHFLSTKLDFS